MPSSILPVVSLPTPLPILNIAPAQVIRGNSVLKTQRGLFARLGQRPLVVGGSHSLAAAEPFFGGAAC